MDLNNKAGKYVNAKMESFEKWQPKGKVKEKANWSVYTVERKPEKAKIKPERRKLA